MTAASATAAPAFDLPPYQSLEGAELAARIERVRAELGPRLLILGHHYQQDEVLAHSDLRGDSYGLSELAANDQQCRAIVFCGVHFMAETADILANRPERLRERGGERVAVVLPDLTAGCQLADMADLGQVERCWRELSEVIDVDDLMPITYVNSTAALKAFCGRRGGLVCTSSNARAALDWAFHRRRRVLFFPDQHLGRNTARAMGIPLDEMPLWDPQQESPFAPRKDVFSRSESQRLPLGGNSPEAIRRSRVILWNGYCGVHQMFLPQHVAHFRQKYPGIKIIVHPECMMEVVELADLSGSTAKIIKEVEATPPGTRWAIGTELHLVNRLRREHPEQEIHLLSTAVCMCSTMFRIDLPHLCWAVENLAAGTPVNRIEVEPDAARGALEALQRMLEVK